MNNLRTLYTENVWNQVSMICERTLLSLLLPCALVEYSNNLPYTKLSAPSECQSNCHSRKLSWLTYRGFIGDWFIWVWNTDTRTSQGKKSFNVCLRSFWSFYCSIFTIYVTKTEHTSLKSIRFLKNDQWVSYKWTVTETVWCKLP